MTPHRTALRQVSLGLLVIAMALLAGCGGSGTDAPGPVTRTISGVVTEENFLVGAKERVACAGSVTVNCTTATIEGDLFSNAVTGPGQDGSDITINATEAIVVTGSIKAANGAAGGAEGNGGTGGDVTLGTTGGSLTLGADQSKGHKQAGATNLSAGDGAAGGNGQLGGAGGEGGAITFNCPNGTLTLSPTPGLFHIGSGGNGGQGAVTGAAAATFTPPAQLPNKGGNCGQFKGSVKTIVGVTLTPTDQTHEGKPIKLANLPDGTITGGDGGNAGSFSLDATTAPAAVKFRRAKSLETIKGADGGNGLHRGGVGQSLSYLASSMPPNSGIPGNDVEITGGDGGDANSKNIGVMDIPDESGVELFQHGIRYGGEGGHVTAHGVNGANGGPGQDGGRGGAITGKGGIGGKANDPMEPPEHWNAGRGGSARVTGGNGGNGGSSPFASGLKAGSGGAGGTATAQGGDGGSSEPYPELSGAGGNAEATGGNGGNGGDGTPGGEGGQGGQATAREGAGTPGGTRRVTNGSNGTRGTDGPGPTTPLYGTVTRSSNQAGKLFLDTAFYNVSSSRRVKAAAVLGSAAHPVSAAVGQSMTVSADGQDLWVAEEGHGIYLYRDFATGGDRGPDVILTYNGVAGEVFWPTSLWLDEARDMLYATYALGRFGPNSNTIAVWNSAALITTNRKPNRLITVSDATGVVAITSGGAGNTGFTLQNSTALGRHIGVLDNLNTRSGSAASSRTITGVSAGGQFGIAYDATRDVLYVERDDMLEGKHAIALISNASTATGNVTYKQLRGAATGLQTPDIGYPGVCAPVALRVFPDTNVLFALAMEGGMLAYANASSLEGNIAPTKRDDALGGRMSFLAWRVK